MNINTLRNREKAVFLDRDGVLNVERGQHTFELEDFVVPTDVPDALRLLKTTGYHLVVITNQSGLARGMYTREQMNRCHDYLHEVTDYVIDAVYYSPYHESVTRSLSRKPGTLMFERAIDRFLVDPAKSWMIGDKNRDLVPAHKLGLRSIMVGEDKATVPLSAQVSTLMEAAHHILAHT